MRTAAQRIGDSTEAEVAGYLRRRGWTILGRNLRVGRAEIDILAVDPGDASPRGAGTLVAVEVRWRASREFGLPEETVSHQKLARLRAAAVALRVDDGAVVPVPALPVRVDIVAVEPDGRLRHHRGVR